MTETHTPLPCPFCGGEAETDLMQLFRHYRTGEPLSQPAVYCTVCSAQIAHYPGDVDLSRDETMDLALTAWNTRAVNSHHRLVEALKVMRSYGCPVCNGDCGSANPPVMSCPMLMIDAALKEAGR